MLRILIALRRATMAHAACSAHLLRRHRPRSRRLPSRRRRRPCRRCRRPHPRHRDHHQRHRPRICHRHPYLHRRRRHRRLGRVAGRLSTPFAAASCATCTRRQPRSAAPTAAPTSNVRPTNGASQSRDAAAWGATAASPPRAMARPPTARSALLPNGAPSLILSLPRPPPLAAIPQATPRAPNRTRRLRRQHVACRWGTSSPLPSPHSW